MKIAILLPYKENYSKNNTGAVSIFVNDVNKLSYFKNNINIYGSTNFKPIESGIRTWYVPSLTSATNMFNGVTLESPHSDTVDVNWLLLPVISTSQIASSASISTSSEFNDPRTSKSKSSLSVEASYPKDK